LYVVCDGDVCAARGWRVADYAAACLEGGAELLQLRLKTASSRTFLDTARTVVELARPGAATVIVNDRADVALFAGAAGVHVGQDDLTPADVRTTLGPEAIVGLSTHTIPQVEAALALPVSYIAIGPIFGTATKATGYEAVGLALVREAAARARERRIPVVAIGGITLDNAVSVLEAGADSVAVISDLLSTSDPAGRSRAFLARVVGRGR
jgi:thiamine-phosphate pyrophosphorylase